MILSNLTTVDLGLTTAVQAESIEGGTGGLQSGAGQACVNAGFDTYSVVPSSLKATLAGNRSPFGCRASDGPVRPLKSPILSITLPGVVVPLTVSMTTISSD